MQKYLLADSGKESNIMSSFNDQPRIAVAGIGGVGGYLAALLARTYDHVSVVARGRRFDAITQNGLVLHSDLHGEVHSKPQAVYAAADDLPEQDYLFICVKNYSLEELLLHLKNAVSEHTVIIPVMNGVDPADRVRKAFSCGTVIKALIYIVSFSNPDYSTRQAGSFADIRLGMDNPNDQEKELIESASSLLTKAGIRNTAADNIALAIWKKYVLNCAYNVETAYYDTTIGPLRDDPVKALEYEALTREAYSIAKAKGIPMTDQDCADIIDLFYHNYENDASSSLQRDIHAGKPAEVETFSGYIVREAEAMGIDVPVSRKMYEGLKSK